MGRRVLAGFGIRGSSRSSFRVGPSPEFLLDCTPLFGVECDLGRHREQVDGCCLILRRCMVKRRPAAYSRVSDGACRHMSANEENKKHKETNCGDQRGFQMLNTCPVVEILLPTCRFMPERMFVARPDARPILAARSLDTTCSQAHSN